MLNPAESAHLIVFGRYPRVGMTKTRLIPALGPAGAAALQKRLAEKTVATARQAAMRIGARLVFCHDGGNAQQLCQWLGDRPIRYLVQAAGDLGRRMHLAMQRAFDVGARRVVLVGTDIPGLTTEMLEEAFSALHEKDLVFGPSIDGGYWLVGMTKPENIFAGIVWSRPDVLEKALALARKKGMTSHLLAPLNDLDTPDDLAREWGSDHVPPPYLSVIIPTIDEAQQMPRTLAAAASPDAEIIVSDGGSTDRTVQIASSLGARIVAGRRGRAGQQNRGAAAARGEVLLFLHADTRLPRNYVDHVFEILMDRRTRLGAFRFATDIHTPAMRCIAFLHQPARRLAQPALRRPGAVPAPTRFRRGWRVSGCTPRRRPLPGSPDGPPWPHRHGSGRSCHLRPTVAAPGANANHADQHHPCRRHSSRCCARALGAAVSFAGPKGQPMKRPQRSPRKRQT